MDIVPQQDLVLVETDPFEDEMRNGVFILKDTTARRVRTGTVLAVGPGRRSKLTGERLPTELEKGDRVAFWRWHEEHKQGKALHWLLLQHGKDLSLLRVADILFKFTGDLRIE